MKKIIIVVILAFIIGGGCVFSLVKAAPGGEGVWGSPAWITVSSEGIVTRWYTGQAAIEVLREVKIGFRSDGVVVWEFKDK